ncbi:hypothetical protein HH219_00450 [Pseudoalteromonas sp. NEC-BIFX-2020_015]|uniref:hypothetical protein n=1 Tax=Pseudoalteromonas sp. NEC-BIFX-2020_015 TaxID=2729544 RepID=UPI0014614226|nr:hypothetical protein [Pseudoalteromonas sp. NEC-BIFX-2020_015]NMR24028.1 hypothetical protein [Pseudoalteromonas sp. NEC-BIFX-2020_015]
MYQEIAFDPRCLAEFHYYGLLKTEFGFEQGRYIIAPVRKWAREAYKAAKESEQLKPVRKKSITTYLNKLQKQKNSSFIVLPNYRKYIDKGSWIDWCEDQMVLAPFKNVISEHFTDALSFNDILERDQRWQITPTVTVDKNAADIVAIIKPLIKLGGDIIIVDQYFRLTNNKVLDGILAEINKSDCITSIKLVTGINTANPKHTFIKQYQNKYSHLPPFELIVAPERFFHDRYIITSFGSIKAGHGFSEAVEQGTQADKLSINLCGKNEADEALDWVFKVVNDGKAKCFRLK